MKNLLRTLLFTLFILFVVNLQAQDSGTTAPADTSYWTRSGTVALNLTTTNLENWQGGGQNSVAIGGIFNYTAKYERDKHLWTTLLEAAYGAQRLGESSTFRKTDDFLHVNSTYGRKLKNKWYLTATFDLRSQLATGEEVRDINADGIEKEEKISSIFAPAFISTGIGVGYKHSFDKEDFFSANFQPISAKITYIGDQTIFDGFPVGEKAYGIEKGSSSNVEIGLITMNFQLQKKLSDNIKVVSALNLFTPIDRIGNFDVNWDVLFTAKINKWLGTSLQYNLIYDDDVISKIQSKFSLGAGITLTI